MIGFWQGLLRGAQHFVTRVPCAHPSDIIQLEAVDYAYENLVVLSVDPDKPNVPASCKARAAADRSPFRHCVSLSTPFRLP